MSLLKGETVTKAGKRTVLVNYNEKIRKSFERFQGMTLIEVDSKEPLVDIFIGSTDMEIDGKDTTINNLILEYKDREIAFPLSRGYDAEVEEDPTVLLNGEFYLTNKFDEAKDTEGEYPYSGPAYISFGKIAGLTVDRKKSLVTAEEVTQ